MMENEYRYTDLTGKATITLEDGFISVTLHDTEVNPNRKPLLFDPPIKSDPACNPTDNAPLEINNIDIVAGLNLEWFKYHTTKDGFRFRKEDGEFAVNWEDLEVPKIDERMDPVRPKDTVASSAQN